MCLHNVVASARAMVPDLKRIALVGTRFEEDPYPPAFRERLPSFTGELEFVDLFGMPTSELKAGFSTLPDDAAVYYGMLPR